MQVQVKKSCKGFLFGDRFHVHADGPVEVPDRKAHELIKLGLVDPVMTVRGAASRAVDPKPGANSR